MALAPDMASPEIEVSLVGMVWSCINEAVWFAAGFLLFRLALRCGALPASLGPAWLVGKAGKAGKAAVKGGKADAKSCPVTKAMVADSGAGKEAAVLAAWRQAADGDTPLQPPALEAAVQALVRLEPESLADELTNYFSKHPSLARPGLVQALVTAVLRLRRPDLAQDFADALAAAKFQSALGAKTCDAVLAAFAARGDAAKVEELLARRDEDKESWSSGANAAIRGFIKSGRPALAMKQLRDMQQCGAVIPPATVGVLLEASCSSKDVPTLKALEGLKGIVIPQEAAAAAMTNCFKYEDPITARGLAAHLREQQPPIPFAVMEPLLKLVAKHDEQWALDLLQEMLDRGMFLSEGLCGLVLSRCGEARHLRLAEAVQTYLRDRKMTSLATYKTLMKVYATCDLLDRACSLYDDIMADGITPDNVMYGCLAKFSVKCGRDDLSEKLFQAVSDKPQSSDVQNCMWLIRSAGQKRDVQRAVRLLRQLQASKATMADAAVYNCVLDVCMTNGDIAEAETIFEEMRKNKLVTLVTYNTLMKGHCAKGEFSRARRLIDEMKEVGLTPDSASFNCLISSAVSTGSFDQAWSVFEDMHRFGLEADSFTLSILMKMVRKARNRRDAQRALSVLDGSKIDVCKDEVLLNTVLDTCIHLKDTRRLSRVLSAFERATLKPSVQNYGLIIKAYSTLKQTKKCWTVWQEMTVERSLLPSDVALSCMLDAVVTGGQVEEAVALFQKWRSAVPPNTIIFSNLIKGFAAQGDAERAMDMYQDLKAEGLQMNLVSYSTLIDAQARSGNTDKAQQLLEQMQKDGVQPNTITFSSLVKGFCLKGDLDGALKVFEATVANGLKADTVMYNTLLDGAVRASRFSLCDQLLREMATCNVEASNFTLSIIVKMWGKRKQLENAFQAVRDAVSEGRLHLDSKLCTCLISACFHNNSPKRALEALEEMKTWVSCDGPDNGTFEQLIDQLCKAKLEREAAKVAMEAIKLASGPSASIRPLNPAVLRQVSRCLEQRGARQLWSPIEEQLRKAHLPMP